MNDRIVTVKVRANTKARAVEEMEDGTLKVLTTATPEKGKANQDVRKLLAAHFRVPRSCVTLVRGTTSSTKRFKIMAQ